MKLEPPCGIFLRWRRLTVLSDRVTRLSALKNLFWTCLVAVIVMGAFPRAAPADPIPKGWQARNMKAVGYSALDGRGGAFKLAIRRVGEHWYLYMGHLWNAGWTVLDVTNPSNPKVAKFVP